MNGIELMKNPERLRESPERNMATAKETASRLKSYGGVLGVIGNLAEKQLVRTEKIDAFAKVAHKAYNEGNGKRVDNMYLYGTQLERIGACKAAMERVKGLDDVQLTKIMQNKDCGRLERTCAKKELDKRLEQEVAGEKSQQENKLQQGERISSKEKQDSQQESDSENLETFEELIKRYYDDLKKFSEYPETIIDDGTLWERLSPEEVAEKRAEFNVNKERLIAEWEKLNGKEWPRYKEDVYVNGKLIRKAGDRYDAHHVKPLSFGGKNEASNLTPISAEKHFDKQGVHSPMSPYGLLEKMAKGVKENET